MKKPFKVCEDIYMVGGSGISGSGDCCIYLVDAGDELVLIDSGLGETSDKIVDNIRSLGFELGKLSALITTHNHIDHIGSHAFFREKLGAKIVAHELDADLIERGGEGTAASIYGIPYTPCPVDIRLSKSEESLRFGKYEFICLHTPGHTPGSISVLVNVKGKKVLFAQDVHGPFSSAWGSDISQWRKSMEKLIELNVDILCEGHFGIYAPADEARKYIESQVRRHTRGD